VLGDESVADRNTSPVGLAFTADGDCDSLYSENSVLFLQYRRVNHTHIMFCHRLTMMKHAKHQVIFISNQYA